MNCLFSDKIVEFSLDKLRENFTSVKKSIGIGLGANQYGQYHAGIVKHFYLQEHHI